MLKRLYCLTATVSVALIPFLSEPTIARPLAINYQYPELISPRINSSICYMETKDGKTFNLNILCAKEVKKLDTNLAPVLKPINSSTQPINFRLKNSSISTKCYFVDSNGRPCNTNN